MIIKISQTEKNVKSLTIEQLLDEIGIKKDNIAVVKNGTIIKKKDWALEMLNENDNIDVFSLVSGG